MFIASSGIADSAFASVDIHPASRTAVTDSIGIAANAASTDAAALSGIALRRRTDTHVKPRLIVAGASRTI
ncbi:MAG: hypothetical protein JKY60_18820 [Kordiimonadaceae bacterium]|nr:hypothetical protein [Kordiimonadaceae bacterium]